MKLHILVTGASKGIGAGIATRFLQDGHDVIVCSRSEENLAELARSSEALPGTLYTTACDMGNAESIESLVSFVHTTFQNKLDILVNNAGIFAPGDLLGIERDNFRQMMDVNFWSAQQLSSALTPLFKSHPCHIFNISSIAALDVYPAGEAYGITKAALSLYSKSLRKALAEFQCRVTTVYPGATYTDSWSGTELPEERFMPVEDIAEIIVNIHALSNRTVVEEITLRPLEGDI